MTTISLTDTSDDLSPISRNERIQALDVVRGFALIGIFLMNIEFFNRALGEIELGLPNNLTGVDRLAGWLTYNFVQGKFWTMFSLLFGMGFAVMLSRAERAGRNFLRPYLRRIAALALFGVLHHVFIWGGDILLSYAVGAVGLLVLLYGDWRAILLALLVLVGASVVTGSDELPVIAGSLAFISIAALFLRGEWKVDFRGRRLPLFAIALLVVGAAMLLVTLALWLLPGVPKDQRMPMTVMSIVVLVLGALSASFHEPLELRTLRLGVAMYVLPFLMMTTFAAIHYFSPSKLDVTTTMSATEAKEGAERLAEREAGRKEYLEEVASERRILTQGSYADAVRFRARELAGRLPEEAGFATVIIGMFLIGTWFVRSGVMENTAAHLPLFRNLALFALPIGVGLGLLGSSIATGRGPDLDHDPYRMAMGLTLIGNLPACLGYVSLIVLMLHSGTVLARIQVLAPLGRMALTNYLAHSIIGTLVFYGYGLGNWGLPRAWQVVFVAVVIALQLLFCHWWLARFRYGPMEWLWRAITYWQLPPMQREAVDAGAGQLPV